MTPGTHGHGTNGHTDPAAQPPPAARSSSAAQSRSDDQSRSNDLASLYPFLYAHSESDAAAGPQAGDLEAVLADVRRSTVDKAHQIVALRREVLALDGQRLSECASAMAKSFAGGGRLFAIGNGGSCTDAADLASLFLHPGPGRQALPAFALTGDIAVLTALSNDVSFDVVFARQIAAFGRRGDVVVGLSTSGNSTNLVRAFDASRAGRQLGVAALLAMCSALINKSLRGGLVVVGGLNLGGSVDLLHNAIDVVELAVEKGASVVLMPVSAR
ncbi:MAG: D-sedoheptulose-7-phosphate isomerase, partial [Pseudonocardiaceae bacterium]